MKFLNRKYLLSDLKKIVKRENTQSKNSNNEWRLDLFTSYLCTFEYNRTLRFMNFDYKLRNKGHDAWEMGISEPNKTLGTSNEQNRCSSIFFK